MSNRYQPGERHLALAGEFVRYFRSFHEIVSREELDIDNDSVLDLAATVFFRDLDSSNELTNAVSMANIYAQVEDDDEEDIEDRAGFQYETTKTDKKPEPDAPDFGNVTGLGDILSRFFDNPRHNN